MTYDEIVRFHGHSCPGLAIGYRMTKAALGILKQSHADDEELVAIVENDACGVDALQCLSGCTFGKGNLLFRDYGKQAYTLFSRKLGKGVRVHFDSAKVPESLRDKREDLVKWLLTEEDPSILSIHDVSINEPEKARIRSSVKCQQCGEHVMDTRIKEVNGKSLCIPCAG